MKINGLLFLALLSLVLAACTGAAAAPPGDAEAGNQLFHSQAIAQAPGCMTCHSTELGKVIVGPSLAGVATRATSRIPGKAAPDYLRESILHPNNYVVDGFSSGVMYQHFEEILTEDQLNDLLAYLLTLK